MQTGQVRCGAAGAARHATRQTARHAVPSAHAGLRRSHLAQRRTDSAFFAGVQECACKQVVVHVDLFNVSSRTPNTPPQGQACCCMTYADAVTSLHAAGRKLDFATSTQRAPRRAVAVEASIFGRVGRVFRSYVNAIGAHTAPPSCACDGRNCAVRHKMHGPPSMLEQAQTNTHRIGSKPERLSVLFVGCSVQGGGPGEDSGAGSE